MRETAQGYRAESQNSVTELAAPTSKPMARSELSTEGHDVTRCDKAYIHQFRCLATHGTGIFSTFFGTQPSHVCTRAPKHIIFRNPEGQPSGFRSHSDNTSVATCQCNLPVAQPRRRAYIHRGAQGNRSHHAQSTREVSNMSKGTRPPGSTTPPPPEIQAMPRNHPLRQTQATMPAIKSMAFAASFRAPIRPTHQPAGAALPIQRCVAANTCSGRINAWQCGTRSQRGK